MAFNLRERWTQRRRELERRGLFAGSCRQCLQSQPAFMVPSVKEVAGATLDTLLHHERQHSSDLDEEDRLARARECTDAGVRAGVKAGSYAFVATAIPTLAAVRYIPWAKQNLNYTGQALIISAATIAAYFIRTEQTILQCSREASYVRLQQERAAKGA